MIWLLRTSKSGPQDAEKVLQVASLCACVYYTCVCMYVIYICVYKICL